MMTSKLRLEEQWEMLRKMEGGEGSQQQKSTLAEINKIKFMERGPGGHRCSSRAIVLNSERETATLETNHQGQSRDLVRALPLT